MTEDNIQEKWDFFLRKEVQIWRNIEMDNCNGTTDMVYIINPGY